MTRSRRLLALVSIPALAILAGCVRMDMDTTLNADETIDFKLTVTDKTGQLTREDFDCTELETQLDFNQDDYPYEMTPVGEEGAYGCEMSATGVPFEEFEGEGLDIERDGDQVTVTLEGSGESDELEGMDQLPPGAMPEVNVSFTFPGGVVDADPGATVDGNRVTWDIEAMTEGGHATGTMTDAAAPPPSPSPDPTASETADPNTGGVEPAGPVEATETSEESTSPLLWIVIGLGVIALALIAVLIVLLAKRRGRPASEAAGAYPGPAGPDGYGTPPGVQPPSAGPGPHDRQGYDQQGGHGPR